MRRGWVLLVALAAGLGGCASVTRGTTEVVQIVSNPPGAEVRTTSGLACLTPCALPMGRKDEFVATFSKEGYEPVSVPVVTRVAGTGAAGFVGNALLGGVIGMGVDVVTGAAMDHCPNPVVVTMRPLRRPPGPPQIVRGKPVPVPTPAYAEEVPPYNIDQCKMVANPETARNDVR